ncbi:unnamed protein product [Urochloa humidicola]
MAGDARAPRRGAHGARAHLGHPGRGRPPPRGDQAGRLVGGDAGRVEGHARAADEGRAPCPHLRVRAAVLPASFRPRRDRALQPAGVREGRHFTVAVGVVKTCFILVATLLSDRVGRRPLLLASAAGVAVALAAVALTLCVPASPAACVASVLAFVAVFSVGLGPVVPTYSSEIMPLRLRAQGTSLGTAVNRVTCALVTMTFISLANWITMPGCFFLYAGVAAAACAFVYVQLPETSGRSLEDMDMLFAK